MDPASFLVFLKPTIILGLQSALSSYRDTPIIAKWWFWIWIPIIIYSMHAVHCAALDLYNSGQLVFPYYIMVDIVANGAMVLAFLFALWWEIHSASGKDIPNQWLLQISLDGFDLQCPVWMDPYPDSHERKNLNEARAAAEARVAFEQAYISRYNARYPLGVFNILVDKARNVEMPFSPAGRQRRYTITRQLFVAVKTWNAAYELEKADGFNQELRTLAMWERWIVELDDEEGKWRGKKTNV